MIFYVGPVIQNTNMANKFLPYAFPDIGDEEITEVVDMLHSARVTSVSSKN